MALAAGARQPRSLTARVGAGLRPPQSKRWRRRAARSATISSTTNTSMNAEICAAPARLPRFSQASKTENVSVLTPRSSTAPISLRHSIIASVTPATMAGRASGKATEKNAPSAVRPSVRETLRALADCIRNTIRVVRNT